MSYLSETAEGVSTPRSVMRRMMYYGGVYSIHVRFHCVDIEVTLLCECACRVWVRGWISRSRASV